MAKIKMGALMTDIRGSAGGQVFARNGGGAYVRNKATPLNPQTASQSGVRALFGQISQAWSQLSEGQRNAFREAVGNYAQTDVFGDEQTLSGKALFQKLNQNLLLAGQTLIDTPPIEQDLAGITSFAPEYNDVAGELNITAMSDDPVGYLFIYATPKLTQGTKFVKNKLRLIKVEPFTSTSFEVSSSYITRFGGISLGDNIYMAVRAVAAEGQNGPLTTAKLVML